MAELCRRLDCRRRVRRLCTLDTLKNTLPIIKWLPKYRLEHFQGDLIAGLTVGLTVLPQGLAYAQVAGLPPEYGLYAGFMGCFIYMLMGTSKDITVGPTAILSLLVGEFGRSVVEHDPTNAIILTLFAGGIQVLMGIFALGFIVEYISHPVINSFTTAAAITIIFSQIKDWFGLKKVPRDFINQVYWTFKKLPETIPGDFIMGLICLIALVALKKLRDIPWGSEDQMTKCKRVIRYIVWLISTARNAIVVLFAAVTVVIFISYGKKPFTTTANIHPGLPPFKVPAFTITNGNVTITTGEIFSTIGVGFAIIPILSVVEAVAIGKAFGKKNNYVIDANQELLALGVCNILSCFVSSYPVTGSFSRTAVNSQSGVKTPGGCLYTGVLVMLALAFLTPYFRYIPVASLAAVIIAACTDLVDFSLIPKLWRVKKIDLIPWFITFIFCFILGVEWGVIIGVGISIFLLLYPWSRPRIRVTPDETTSLLNATDNDNNCQDTAQGDGVEYIVLSLSQGLMFPGIEHIKDVITKKAFADGNKKSVILDMHHVANIDFTTIEGIIALLADFQFKGAALVICDAQPDILEVLQKAQIKHFLYAPTVAEAISVINERRQEGNANAAFVAIEDPVIEHLPDDVIGYGNTAAVSINTESDA